MNQPARPPTDRGLIWAYLLDRAGGGHRVDWQGLTSWRPEQGLLWAHFDVSEPGPDGWLEDKSGLEPQIAAALLAEDTRPRSAPSRNGLLVILRGVNLNPGAEPDDMVSVRVWLERDRIITTRRRQLKTNSEIRAAVDNGEGPSSAGEFLGMLVERMVDHIGDAVSEIDEQIDAVEMAFTEQSVLQARHQLTSLRLQTAHLRRFLAPQRDALERIVRQPDPILTEQDNLTVREQADRVQRFLEDLDLIRERAMVSQEEFIGRMAYQQNQRIYVLSVVAAIFLPLTFLTGLMGMNVGGLPGSDSRFGFAATALAMAAVAGAVAFYFRRRHWL